jgi:beta-galactosidase/beta-glucuronidase
MVNGSQAVSAHPRPQLRRAQWRALDGLWDFALETRATWASPGQVQWQGSIRVPFAPETEASGVHDEGFHEVVWYRCVLPPESLRADERLVLHFNAVDYTAEVWANDVFLARHRGGYTPFQVELTAFAATGQPITVVVRAHDDPHDLAKPRGKQDWQLEPHSIWYPRTSGIWQTVWIEKTPETWVAGLRWTPNLERWEIGLDLHLGGRVQQDMRLKVELRADDQTLSSDLYSVTAGEVLRRIGLSDPGIDDYRNELLWSPHSPTLIQAHLELMDSAGRPIDVVESYTALRSVSVHGANFLLNGRPYPLRMVLDQGYWPATGLTPPDTEALRRDVELTKAMGFNGARKHQKVEDPRYLYWADRLGLLVWSEMPSAYRFTSLTVRRLAREWMNVIRRDYSHPCVVVWVPFNESWGVPNLPEIAAQRHLVEALYHLTKTLDPTRPVVGNDGWESAATDLIGIHDYDEAPDRLESRYRLHDTIPQLFRRERPAGRLLTLESHPHVGQPIVLSEFGGIACYDGNEPGLRWGYSKAPSRASFAERYKALLEVVRTLPALAGFCYTQFADTYQEANGLLQADRTPKIPIDQIAEATRGPRVSRHIEGEGSGEARLFKPGPSPPHDPKAP